MITLDCKYNQIKVFTDDLDASAESQLRAMCEQPFMAGSKIRIMPDVHMGKGCTITQWHGKHRITHNGGHTGFRTLHVQLPEEDFDLIFLSNSGYGDARNAISEMVYRAFYGDPAEEGAALAMDRGYI